MQFCREIQWLGLERLSRCAREALGICPGSGIWDVHREENWQQGCYPTSPIPPDLHQTSSTPLALMGLLVNESELNHPTHTPRSELPPKLLPLNISQALEMALEQKELDQEPGAGKCILSRTGFVDWNSVQVAIGRKQ